MINVIGNRIAISACMIAAFNLLATGIADQSQIHTTFIVAGGLIGFAMMRAAAASREKKIES
jgi:hypothetical protein